MLDPTDGLDSNEASAKACLWQTLGGGLARGTCTLLVHTSMLGQAHSRWRPRVRPGSSLQLLVSSIWATSEQAPAP